MSNHSGRLLTHSVVQSFSGLMTTALNFALMFAYARQLGPETLGRLVASQAQVLVWIVLVDLGMTAGLMSALTHADRAHRKSLVSRVFRYRIIGAVIATVSISMLSGLTCTRASCFQENLAFAPYLFGYALQYTLASTLVFYGRLPLTVLANLCGVFVANGAAAFLLLKGQATITSLLFVQGMSGFIAYLVMRTFRGPIADFELNDVQDKTSAFSLKEVFRDIWPNTVVLAVMSVAARLDQIAIAHASGFERGGQYALAVRLVAIPVLVSASIHFALFSDMQRVGRDDPGKLAFFAQIAAKWFLRFGPFIAGVFLAIAGLSVLSFLPKFKPAISLLPFFVPGLVAYFVYNVLSAALLGLRAYRKVAELHLISLVAYGVVIAVAVIQKSQTGIILAYNVFYVSLAALGFHAFKREALARQMSFSSYVWFDRSESDWLKAAYQKVLARLSLRSRLPG